MLESALDNLAERILSLDEASLASLWEKYKSPNGAIRTLQRMGKSGHYLFHHQCSPGKKPHLQRTDPQAARGKSGEKTAEEKTRSEARQIKKSMVSMDHGSAARKVEELKAAILHHNRRYYQLDAPEITDTEYDALMRELQTLEMQYPDLAAPDSPTRRVGAPPLDKFATVAHLTPMLSLANAFSAEEIREFDRGAGGSWVAMRPSATSWNPSWTAWPSTSFTNMALSWSDPRGGTGP